MNNYYLKIADLNYEVSPLLKLPYNYLPFRASRDENLPLASRIDIAAIQMQKGSVCHKGLAIDPDKELYIYKLEDGSYYATVTCKESEELFQLKADAQWAQVTFSKNTVTDCCPVSVVDLFMMLTFIYSSANYQSVLMHASCIKHGEDALAFIGHSGAGKSTHSSLWLNNIPGTLLLNDDQPAVRVFDQGKIRIFGTPWSGKTDCYVQNSGTLRGIVRMKQAPYNELITLNPIQLFQELLSSCSMIKADPPTFRLITGTLAKIASHIAGCVLKNRPERNAVMILYNYMFKTRNN